MLTLAWIEVGHIMLQNASHRRIDQGHLYLSPLRVFVLLHLNLYGDLVKDRDGDVFILRRRDSQRVVFGVVFWIPFEHDDAFESEPIRIRQIGLISPSCGWHVLGDKHSEAVPERPDDKGLLLYDRFLHSSLQCQANVELDAGAAGHLGHPMTAIDHIKRPFNVPFRV